MIKNVIIGILIAVIIGGAGWYYVDNIHHTSIDNILKNPRSFDGKVLTIYGEVTERTSIIIVKYFKVKDDTGEMIVITNRVLPSIGSKVRVIGKVREAYSIGDEQVLVLIEGSSDKK